MNVLERFLEYVKIPTVSDPSCETVPSTDKQFVLAKKLAQELVSIGAENVECDDKCYVYGEIKASEGYENAPRIGFVAHMDTAPDFCGDNVSPKVITNYDGADIPLGDSGRTLSSKEFPHLKNLCGKTLVVTDGTTLLGGDDKAGVAEIMTAVEKIISEGIPHGKISICFTPDEEIGRGADEFSIDRFGADFAYTVDGGNISEVEYENFNACGAVYEVSGFNVHPGSSKDTMINAQLVAMEINSMLPKGQTPRDTEGYEGFFHLCSMEGCVEKATLEYIIRDHSAERFEERKRILTDIAEKINAKYGEGTVKLTIRDQYRNMEEIIKQHFHLIENALSAIRSVGEDAHTVPIRGGTDGARLSFMGLPCPNIGTGCYAGHGPYEHAVVEDMEKVVDIILGIIQLYSQKQ